VHELQTTNRELQQKKKQAEDEVASVAGKIEKNEAKLKQTIAKCERLRLAFSKKMRFTPSKKQTAFSTPTRSTAKRALYEDTKMFKQDDDFESDMIKAMEKIENQADGQNCANNAVKTEALQANDEISYEQALNMVE